MNEKVNTTEVNVAEVDRDSLTIDRCQTDRAIPNTGLFDIGVDFD